MDSRSKRALAWIGALAAAVTACGGGGGSDPGSAPPPNSPNPQTPAPTLPERPSAPVVQYSGNALAANVEAANAREWVSSAYATLSWTEPLLELFVVDVFDLVDVFTSQPQAVVHETHNGPEGGRVVAQGVLTSEQRPNSTTGWLSMEFEDYGDNGRIIDGRVVLELLTPKTVTSHSIVLELTDVHVTRNGVTELFHGTMRDVLASQASGYLRTVTLDLLRRDVASGATLWAQNVKKERVRPLVFAFDEVYSGRLYDADAGYVDLSSDAPHTFISNETTPDRGGALRLTGAANASAGLVPLNRDYGAIVLDEDGDGADERFVRASFEEIAQAHWTTVTPGVPPVANAGARRFVDVGEPVALNGLSSDDPDGAFLAAQWTLALKPFGSAATLDMRAPLTPSFTPDIPGVYTFLLEVHDDDRVAHDSVQLTAATSSSWNRGVQMQMDRPAVAPLGTPIMLNAGTSRREDLSNSAPLDVLYSWSLEAPAGSNAALTSLTDPNPTFIPDVPGYYQITVENGVPSPNYMGRATKIVGFETPVQYHESAHMALGGLWGDPVLLDLDEDGILDVASLGVSPVDGAWSIRLFFGEGGGTLAAGPEFPVDNSVLQLLHGDLDGDGLQDLVTLGHDTLFVVYWRPSAAAFTAIPLVRSTSCGAHARSAAIGRAPGDDRAQLFVTDRCTPEIVTWRHTNGELGIVGAQPIPELAGAPVAFGDLTGDGRLDFVVRREPPNPREALPVFAQDASGAFAQTAALEGVLAHAFAIGDATGDARSDLVVVRSTGEAVVSVYAQSESGGLLPAVHYDKVGRVASIPPRFADLDGDGRTDLVAVYDRDTLLLGFQQPNGTLQFMVLPDDLDNTEVGAVPGDLNGDGRVDLVRRREWIGDVGLSVRFAMP